MASFCDGKPPAKVLIQFKNGAKEEVVSDAVPFDVSVTKKKPVETEQNNEDDATGNCCDIPYAVKIHYTYCELSFQNPGQCAGDPISGDTTASAVGKILSIQLSEFNGVKNAISVTRKGCDGKQETLNLVSVPGKILSYSIQTITRADGKPDVCDPPDDDSNKCVITIKDKNGKTIYKKEAECPIKFKVRCGNQCADGEIRCESNSYPGYCCINCEDLARAIR